MWNPDESKGVGTWVFRMTMTLPARGAVLRGLQGWGSEGSIPQSGEGISETAKRSD